MNLINELGELAMATRMMRLSEETRRDTTRIYQEHHLNFEAKWFPVLYVLSQKGPLSVIEVAEEIGYAHPSVIALVKDMQKEKLVRSAASKTDGRKRMLSLTTKARNMIADLELLWADFRAINHIIYNNGSSLLKAIEDCEAALKESSFYERYKQLEAKRKKRRK